MTTTTSAALVAVAPVFSNAERLALAGFLTGYSGLTREAYALDLRQFAAWCSASPEAAVRCPPCRHRVLRPRPRSQGPGPGNGDPRACPQPTAGF